MHVCVHHMHCLNFLASTIHIRHVCLYAGSHAAPVARRHVSMTAESRPE